MGVGVSEARLRGPGHGRETSTGSFFQEGGLGAEALSPAGVYSAGPALSTHTSASSGRGGVGWEGWESERGDPSPLFVPPSTSDPGDTPPKRKKVVVQG